MDLLEVKDRKTRVMSRHPWELARLKVAQRLIASKIKLPQGCTVLDVGCGDTFVVENLARQYPDSSFFAIDTAFNEQLIKDYKEKMSVNNVFIFESLEKAAPFISGNVSLVVLMDVIEHIEDDVFFLEGLQEYSFIDHHTQFFITVPAYQAMYCSHDTYLGHYRRYTNVLLRRNVNSSGLQIVDIGYFFFSLLPLRMLQVIKEKVFKKRLQMSTGLVEWQGSVFISNVINAVLICDFKISRFLSKIGIKVPGLSNYAICRKIV